MAKLSAFEGFMILAVAVLCLGMVWPRVAQADSTVLASRAQVLEMRLQGAYDLWKLNGGLHGAGNPSSPEVLTKNLIECLTSEAGKPYCSKALNGPHAGKLVLGRSGVYESVRSYPGPSSVRIENLKLGLQMAEVKTGSGNIEKAILVNGHFGVVFNDGRWTVAAIN